MTPDNQNCLWEGSRGERGGRGRPEVGGLNGIAAFFLLLKGAAFEH